MITELKFEWRVKAGRFASGCALYVNGAFRVGSTYEGISSKSDTRGRWRATIELPGLKVKDDANFFESDTDARAVVERIVTSWFKRAGVLE